MAADDFDHPAYQIWVRQRVALARRFFDEGKRYISGVGNRRRPLAGFAYIARFEWMARLIERDDYHLRATYPERKSSRAALWVAWNALRNLRGTL